MELRHLRYFLSIAELSSFRAAAEELFVSQPTLSQQMKDLERELGTALFERAGRGVRLTQAGKLFVEYAHRSLNILQEGQAAILEYDSVLRGCLRIGVLQTVGTYLIPQAIVKFTNKYPRVDLRVLEMSAREIESGLIDGGLDLGISFEPISKAAFLVETLFCQQLMLLVSKQHPLSGRKRIRCADLAQHRLCLLNRKFSTRQMIDTAFAEAKVPLDVAAELNSVSACVAVAKAGGPATILPELAVRENKSAVGIRIERPIVKRKVCLLNTKTQSPIRAQSEFAKAMIESVRDSRLSM